VHCRTLRPSFFCCGRLFASRLAATHGKTLPAPHSASGARGPLRRNRRLVRISRIHSRNCPRAPRMQEASSSADSPRVSAQEKAVHAARRSERLSQCFGKENPLVTCWAPKWQVSISLMPAAGSFKKGMASLGSQTTRQPQPTF
jgi:hypothetical protein